MVTSSDIFHAGVEGRQTKTPILHFANCFQANARSLRTFLRNYVNAQRNQQWLSVVAAACRSHCHHDCETRERWDFFSYLISSLCVNCHVLCGQSYFECICQFM